jgi:hypothetical protein
MKLSKKCFEIFFQNGGEFFGLFDASHFVMTASEFVPNFGLQWNSTL